MARNEKYGIIMNTRVKYKTDLDYKFDTIYGVGNAGVDLVADIEQPYILKPGEKCVIPTGLSIELPLGYVGFVCSRSGLASKNSIHVLNSPGIIDSDYRGEIKAILYNSGEQDFEIQSLSRIAQLVVLPCPHIDWVLTHVLSDTVRGDQGLGSTGLK